MPDRGDIRMAAHGARLQDPLGDHRQHQVARPRVGRPAAPAEQQLGQAQPLGRAQHGGDVPVRQRARDGQRLLGAFHRDAALEQGAQALDQVRRPIAQIGPGALFDPAAPEHDPERGSHLSGFCSN
ncbi:hypothetical protein [Rhodovibrio sodomensis]|uniref:hypothetical protein n=1 Tax=Rhodovibrio sodomensis TaxID=1088 RepID=UPI003F580701